MLRNQPSDQRVRDFQDWPAWRRILVTTGAAIVEQTGQTLVAPQTVLNREYLADSDSQPRPWRLERVEDFVAARGWLREVADLIVDTESSEPVEVVDNILSGWR